jgi:glycosyltransferase involved in cell wall biosynthesis
VERRTLAAIYRRAALVVYPSEREGFGLPLVEAMACGATAVASDLPVFREVAGDAVQYVTRDDPDGWAEAIGDAIDRLASPEARAQARAAALRRAERFTLAAYGRSIARIYADVLEAA